MLRWGGVLSAAFVLLAGQRAWAQTCLVSSSGVAFGTYAPFAPTGTSSTGTVSVTCQPIAAVGLSYSIQISAGGGGGFNSRSLSAGSGRLAYQLYTSTARNTPWGDGTDGTAIVSDVIQLSLLTTVTRSYTIYGLIPARQMAPPGAYADVLTLMLVY